MKRAYRVSYFDMTDETGSLTVTHTTDEELDNLLDDPVIDVIGFTLLEGREVEMIEGLKEVEKAKKSKYQIEKEKYQFGEDDEDEPFRWDGQGI